MKGLTKMSFYLFWNGFCGQWFKSPFVDENGIKFNTAEQYMMYQKAITFDDNEIANRILEETNPKVQKALGRQVKNFDVDVWNAVSRDVVYKGNYLKFTQNPNLKVLLLNVKEDELVEASPYDKIWGIGMGADDPRCQDKNKWQGSNWLGEVLTKLRNNLKEM